MPALVAGLEASKLAVFAKRVAKCDQKSQIAIYQAAPGKSAPLKYPKCWHDDCILHFRLLVSHSGVDDGVRQHRQDNMNTTGMNGSDFGAPALIDDAAMAALAADVGANNLVTVLMAFSDELQRRVTVLQRALDANDLAAIARETHSIKGSALTFGAAALGAAARRANDASRAGDGATALLGAREVLALMPETRDAVARLAAQTAEVQQ